MVQKNVIQRRVNQHDKKNETFILVRRFMLFGVQIILQNFF